MRAERDTHLGEEFVFILKGQLEIRVGEEVFTLRAGDGVHYQGSHPHTWHKQSGKESTLIWASLPSREWREGG